jgi:hypothetical protein
MGRPSRVARTASPTPHAETSDRLPGTTAATRARAPPTKGRRPTLSGSNRGQPRVRSAKPCGGSAIYCHLALLLFRPAFGFPHESRILSTIRSFGPAQQRIVLPLHSLEALRGSTFARPGAGSARHRDRRPPRTLPPGRNQRNQVARALPRIRAPARAPLDLFGMWCRRGYRPHRSCCLTRQRFRIFPDRVPAYRSAAVGSIERATSTATTRHRPARRGLEG